MGERGEHGRLLDDKGRLVLPPAFRRRWDESVFLARSATKPCIMMFSDEGIQEVADRLRDRVRSGEVSEDAQRRWSSSITEVRIDGQGRIPIPPKLRSQVGLDREVVVIGVVDRAEVWDASAWAAVESAIDEEVNEGLWL
jgi:MraZ protein